MSDSRMCSRFLVVGCALGMWACGDATPPDAGVAADAAPPVGRVSLEWQISDGTNALTCADVGAQVVRIQALPVGGGSATIDTLPCEDGVGSVPLREYAYDVEVALIGSALEPLGETFTKENVNIRKNETTSLGTVSLVVAPRGNVEFFLDAAGAGGNCEAEPDGAGITQISLELRDRAGACVPATFEIGAGATRPAGTYVTDCAGARFDCVENDQLVRAVGVRSGQQSLRIRGLRGEQECYQRNSQFNVPGGDLTTNLESLALALDVSCGGEVPDAGVDAPDAGVDAAAQ